MNTAVTDTLIKLGRFMITHAPQFADDATCNNWARVGNMLTGLGMPFAPRLREFAADDQAVVLAAAAVMSGRVEMPPKLEFEPPAEPRRTRKARMTRVMTKPERKAAPTKAAAKKAAPASAEPKRRGRPPGSKNKAKVEAKSTGKVIKAVKTGTKHKGG